MFIARVRGNVVTTQKVKTMTGRKLLVVEPLQVDEAGKAFRNTGRTLVTVDAVGAGTDDLVLVTQGSSARMAEGMSDAPVDCVVIGIVDSLSVLGDQMYKKGKQ